MLSSGEIIPRLHCTVCDYHATKILWNCAAPARGAARAASGHAAAVPPSSVMNSRRFN